MNRATGEIVGIGQYARDGGHTIDEVLEGVVADLKKGIAGPAAPFVPPSQETQAPSGP